jgi:DNA-binding beta-propeller fold protein YncE
MNKLRLIMASLFALMASMTLSAQEAAKTTGKSLPGLQINGEVRLPNGWTLKPAGKQIPLGDFPVNIAMHPTGKYLAVLHAGYGTHEIIVLETDKAGANITSRTTLKQTFAGICFAPDGKKLYASAAEHASALSFDFVNGALIAGKEIQLAPKESTFITSGLAVDSTGKKIIGAGCWGFSVAIAPIDGTGKATVVDLGKDSYPFAILPVPGKEQAFVSLWGGSSVALLETNEGKVLGRWATESHPTEMALSPDGKTLFVSCSNSTKVSILDVADNGKNLGTLNCALYASVPNGNTPGSLTLTNDGKLLIVANSDANNLSLFQVDNPRKPVPMGYIPTGWYPTSVRYNPADKKLYVANGKGLTSRPNYQGPNPLATKDLPIRQYIAGLMQGSLGILDIPSPEKLVEFTKEAYSCSPLKEGNLPPMDWAKDNPIPRRIGESSPIKHCIYIIKENRTYDQVFGDMKEGNGDPNLCIFGEKVTPNQHKLSREFVLLDNFYVEGEVSADGHQWSMAAYSTDFVERVWPLTYRGSTLKKLTAYPSEGAYDPIARPSGGYIWDRCIEAKVPFRSYGEWVDNPKKIGEPARAKVKAIEGNFDPYYHGYDLDYPDVKRAERFLSELKRFEKEGGMPGLSIVRLPNDHTYGTRPGKPTPTAMVAENDYALGLLVEGVSKSKFWKETAIFVIEDDAQNGSDHVDAHRSTALVISPYTKRGSVDSTMYSTSSMLRTMELILGLKPMSQFDAAATPMFNCFQTKPNLKSFEHVAPQVSVTQLNKTDAWGAQLSMQFDLSTEDLADDLLFNEVIWRSVKGPSSPMPAPVRAAFFIPKSTIKPARKD